MHYDFCFSGCKWIEWLILIIYSTFIDIIVVTAVFIYNSHATGIIEAIIQLCPFCCWQGFSSS